MKLLSKALNRFGKNRLFIKKKEIVCNKQKQNTKKSCKNWIKDIMSKLRNINKRKRRPRKNDSIFMSVI